MDTTAVLVRLYLGSHCVSRSVLSGFLQPHGLVPAILLCPWKAQLVKNLLAMQETWVRSLRGEDPAEKGMATHSSILAWKNSMDRGTWWAIVHRVTTSWIRLSN